MAKKKKKSKLQVICLSDWNFQKYTNDTGFDIQNELDSCVSVSYERAQVKLLSK